MSSHRRGAACYAPACPGVNITAAPWGTACRARCRREGLSWSKRLLSAVQFAAVFDLLATPVWLSLRTKWCRLNLFKRRAKMEIVASSGILRVTVPPRESWFLILVVIAADVAFAVMTYSGWSRTWVWVHLIFVWAIIGGVLGLVYQLAVTQIIEIDAQHLTGCKEIHGWERKQEYQIANCNELKWVSASEGRSAGLQCKIGWRKVMAVKIYPKTKQSKFSRLCKRAFQASLKNCARIQIPRNTSLLQDSANKSTFSASATPESPHLYGNATTPFT
jgi:hypothetical protein